MGKVYQLFDSKPAVARIEPPKTATPTDLIRLMIAALETQPDKVMALKTFDALYGYFVMQNGHNIPVDDEIEKALKNVNKMKILQWLTDE